MDFNCSPYEILCVCYSPDGTMIVTGSRNSIIAIWDAKSGDKIKELKKYHVDRLTNISFSPDN